MLADARSPGGRGRGRWTALTVNGAVVSDLGGGVHRSQDAGGRAEPGGEGGGPVDGRDGERRGRILRSSGGAGPCAHGALCGALVLPAGTEGKQRSEGPHEVESSHLIAGPFIHRRLAEERPWTVGSLTGFG
jgi:hypothetical protein